MVQLGYDTHNSILNLGSVFIFLCCIFLKLILLMIFRIWLNFYDKHRKVYDKHISKLFYENFIVLFIEGFLEF